MHGPVRPRVVVSECLGFAAVRYNGQILRSRFVDALREHVEFVQVCPEVGIGLGVPRDPIRVVEAPSGDARERRLVQPSTDRDLTEDMRSFSAGFLGRQDGAVDGFILKSKSPSCGISDAKIMSGPDEGSPTLGRGPGLFAEAVQDRFGWAAVEDEGRLTNLRIRHHFLTKLWAMARLRRVSESGAISGLVGFHTRYKLLLMSYHQERVRELGRIVANPDGRPFRELASDYRAALGVALAEPADPGNVVNALQHAFGYISDELDAQERRYFLELLSRFREGTLPLPALLAVLQSWVVRFREGYLDAQRLFLPYPRDLFDLHSSGSGHLV
ncbi:MAG TPA: DUF523 and DUF1722 domain-containing protein [Longimicrobiales bacterium]|nr:DUF523 and DUF1722 domain-containing protein [Longimicrobiales bacterium]